MALSTLRLRENQLARPGVRQYAERTARPSPQDLQEVLTLTKSLQKIRVTDKPDLLPQRAVLPDIKPQTITFTDCDEDVTFDETLDKVCNSVSEESIKSFLKKSQIMVNVLHAWWWDSTHSIEFLNWWFSKLNCEARTDWFKLECSILLEEISASIVDESGLTSKNVMEFLLSILHEHPHVFCNKGEHSRLPDMIEVLVSGDKSLYCQLLSNVKCKTSKQEVALAIRTYCIISLCYNSMTFYRKLLTENVHTESRSISRSSTLVNISREATRPPTRSGRPGSSMGSRPTTAQNIHRVEQHNILRAFDAVNLGYVAVLKYMFSKGYVDSLVTDEQGRSLLFVATLHKQHAILNYLLSSDVIPAADVNRVADNGNTPLHVAASSGDSLTLNILLKSGADPNLYNPESNGATPLHLAVLHDHVDVVVLLLGAGADPMVRMGLPANTSSIDLARQLDHSDVLKLLIGSVPVRPDSSLYVGEVWD